ncbi:MAG TPA: hypothetical protein VF760_00320, partial [Xanthobacteraceae bacterium]
NGPIRDYRTKFFSARRGPMKLPPRLDGEALLTHWLRSRSLRSSHAAAASGRLTIREPISAADGRRKTVIPDDDVAARFGVNECTPYPKYRSMMRR